VLPKQVYAARLLSDKMLVYANALRDEIEEIIPLLLVADVEKDNNGSSSSSSHTSYFCDEASPSSDWGIYPGGIQQDPIFSFVSRRTDFQQTSALASVYRCRKVAVMDASLYDKEKGADASALSSPRVDDTCVTVDGKSLRGSRRWSVGLGEKEMVDNVGATPIRGTPAFLTAQSIPVQSAIQWGECCV
jgi:hypothetical protein